MRHRFAPAAGICSWIRAPRTNGTGLGAVAGPDREFTSGWRASRESGPNLVPPAGISFEWRASRESCLSPESVASILADELEPTLGAWRA
jgi:hypothetical protein